MKTFCRFWLFILLTGLATGLNAQEPPPPPAGEKLEKGEPEVMARGPIHEAFAAPVNPKPEAGPIVPKKPPEPVPEVPPDQKPKGENVQWVPGYWAWDLEKKDFIWVSGVWRQAPPKRKWVPGYWNAAEGGWQWVSGFWAPVGQEELKYREAPPDPVENGPSAPQPNQDSIYVPGSWIPRDGRYAWRPGYWNEAHADWVWNPANYIWTPAGYLYVDGYWDYPLNDRGLLFAPAYYAQPLYLNPGYTYTPSYVVDPGALASCLWFGPGGGNYWFGNCYGPVWRGWGFQPWCNWGPRVWDGLWGHGVWANRFNRGWAAGLRNSFAARFNGTALRPGINIAGQRNVLNTARNQNINVTNINSLRLVNSLNNINHSPMTRLNSAQLNQAVNGARNVNAAASARGQAEAGGVSNRGNFTSRMPGSTTSSMAHNTGNPGGTRPGFGDAPRGSGNFAQGSYGAGQRSFSPGMGDRPAAQGSRGTFASEGMRSPGAGNVARPGSTAMARPGGTGMPNNAGARYAPNTSAYRGGAPGMSRLPVASNPGYRSPATMARSPAVGGGRGVAGGGRGFSGGGGRGGGGRGGRR